MRKRATTSSATSSPKNARAGGCFAIIWCSVSSLFLIGGIFLIIKGVKEASWIEVPCEIERLEVTWQQAEAEPFDIETVFSYQYEGQNYRSERFSSNSSRGDDYEKLYEKTLDAREQSACYLDPANPSEAVLATSPLTILAGGILTAVSTLFLAIGLWIGLSSRRKGKALSSGGKTSQSARKSRAGPIAFSIFFLVGLIAFLLFSLPSFRKHQALKSWPSAPATVIWSEVRSHQGDDGTTYSVDIFYQYRFQGNDYHSNRYKFLRGSSSGRAAKAEIVASYPAGRSLEVFVNPEKPWQAVIERRPGWALVFLFFPAPFLLIGGIGLASHFRKGSSVHSPRSAHLPRRSDAPALPIKPGKRSRFGKFFGLLVFALFWNGIVSVFVFLAWKSGSGGSPDWFLTIFIIPFVLIGLVVIAALPHSLLALFSPYFSFELSPPELVPGTRVTAKWRQSGGSGAMSAMSLTLVGEEIATYQQGTDTRTATSTFHRQIVKESTRRDEIMAGQAEFVIPTNAVPSFQSAHNQIRWFLIHHVAVAQRPDVRDEVPLTIHPHMQSDFS